MGTKRCSKMVMLVLLCVVLAGEWSPAWARMIYVDDDAPPPGDGTSWATAFRYLQDAMAATSAGDEIRVAQGLYRPDQAYGVVEGKRGATFLLDDGVAILGGFAGVGAADPDLRDPDRFATILSGDLTGDDGSGNPLARHNNSYHVVMAPGVGSDTILDGLTICHAYTADHHGGGMYNGGGSPLLRHCTFRDNLASDGDAGVYNDKGDLRIEYCRFLRNSGEDSGALCNHQGSVVVIASEFIDNHSDNGPAAVFNEEGDMVLSDCLFRDNRSDEGMGTVWNRGDLRLLHCTFVDNEGHGGKAAVYNDQGNAVLFACLFRGNRNDDGTGAVLNRADLRLLHCTFVENGGPGGAVTCKDGHAVIAHCLFVGNMGEDAGAMSVRSASASLDQCTFYANVSTGGGAGAVYCRRAFSWSTRPAGSFQARGCIFWANGALNYDGTDRTTGYEAQIDGDPNQIVVEYSCIDGWTAERGGMGNLGMDPLFVAPDQNDFHLQSQAGHWDAAFQAWVFDDVTSPCIDAGDPNRPVEQEPFPNGGIVNMGAYGGTSEASKSWFGAEPCTTIDAADLNGDCRVDAEDYRLATQRWPQVGQ